MELIGKSFFSLLMRIWSHIYTYRISQRYKGLRDRMYTLWIRNFIGEVGDNCRFQYPLRLQGGGSKRICIGASTIIGSNSVLGSWEHHGKDECYEPEIIIGNDCNIGEYCHITAISKIIIGDGLLTGRFVFIGDNAHGGLSFEEAAIPPIQRHLISKGSIVIGRNVWIGDKVTILGGVTIGDNVIIGANSVVTHDIPSNTIVAGTCSREIKKID